MSLLFNPYEVYIQRHTSLALSASLLGHSLLFTLGWGYLKSQTPPVVKPSLSVILINKKSIATSDRPDALAQANLNGSGNTDMKDQQARALITPPSRKVQENYSTGAADTQKLSATGQHEDKRYLVAPSDKPLHQTARPSNENNKDQHAAAEASQRVAEEASLPSTPSIAGKLSTSLSTEQTGTQQSKILGANTREYRFADYLEGWMQKMERVGTQDYRSALKNRHLQGSSLEIYLRIKANGELDYVRITRSSGSPELDQLALDIAKRSSPFDPFPEALRAETQIMSITRTYTFIKGRGTTRFQPSSTGAH